MLHRSPATANRMRLVRFGSRRLGMASGLCKKRNAWIMPPRGEPSCPPPIPSVHLEAGRLYNRGPALQLLCDQRRKVLRRAADRLETDPLHARAQLRRLEAVVDLAIDPRDHLRGRASRTEEAVVGDGRQLGQAAF